MNSKWLPLLAVLALASLVSGCYSLPKAADMTPGALQLRRKVDAPVHVVVHGEGRLEKQVLVGNAEIRQALVDAARASGLFAEVADAPGSGHLLEVSLVGFTPPRPGFDMTASVSSRWRLTRPPETKPIFEDFLKTTHTVTTGEAFVGATRYRRACEGAIREMIADGLRRISEASW